MGVKDKAATADITHTLSNLLDVSVKNLCTENLYTAPIIDSIKSLYCADH